MRRINAESLIELVILALRTEIAPNLPREQRYAAAMVASALEIARREILTDGEAAAWKLLDTVYDDGEGSLGDLARDIRSGKISEKSHPGLEDGLREMLLAELAIRNPKAVPRR